MLRPRVALLAAVAISTSGLASAATLRSSQRIIRLSLFGDDGKPSTYQSGAATVEMLGLGPTTIETQAFAQTEVSTATAVPAAFVESVESEKFTYSLSGVTGKAKTPTLSSQSALSGLAVAPAKQAQRATESLRAKLSDVATAAAKLSKKSSMVSRSSLSGAAAAQLYAYADAPAAAGPARRYVVDNTVLQASTPGLGYRKSKDPEDRIATDPIAKWGEEVTGIDVGNGWVQVGEGQFLPLASEGVPVLVAVVPPAAPAPAPAAEVATATTATTTLRPVLMPIISGDGMKWDFVTGTPGMQAQSYLNSQWPANPLLPPSDATVAAPPAAADLCGTLFGMAGKVGESGQFTECRELRDSPGALLGCHCGAWSAACPFQTCRVNEAWEGSCLEPQVESLGFVALSHSRQKLPEAALPRGLGGFTAGNPGSVSLCMYWLPDPTTTTTLYPTTINMAASAAASSASSPAAAA